MNARTQPTSFPLLEWVKDLENLSNPLRGQRVQAALQSLGIEFILQENRFFKVKNIIADLGPATSQKRLLFSAHYDAVKGSPGANDNASGAAVLLGLCRELKEAGIPLRIVFFDREEAWFRTPFIRLGLLGSLHYVLRNSLKNTTAVYNLEYCGLGEIVAIWPLKSGELSLPAVKGVTGAAARLNLDIKSAHLPWFLLSSDHLSFRLRGFPNALTLSLLPASQIQSLEKMLSGMSWRDFLFKPRLRLPGPLSLIHTRSDTSSRLTEDSLRRMLSLLLELVNEQQLIDTSQPGPPV